MPYTIPTYTLPENDDLTINDPYIVLFKIVYFHGAATDRAIYRVYKNINRYPDRPIDRIVVEFDIQAVGGGNWIAQANAALLALPIMAGAVEV